jgi:hypothetical protein
MADDVGGKERDLSADCLIRMDTFILLAPELFFFLILAHLVYKM